MKIGLAGNAIIIKEANQAQFSVIKSWNRLRWDRKQQKFIGTVDMDLLDKLANIVKLPPAIAKRREELHAAIAKRQEEIHVVQDAVDRERVNEYPEPLVNYPVKMPLYAHQTRGANMALIIFGWVSPENILLKKGK